MHWWSADHCNATYVICIHSHFLFFCLENLISSCPRIFSLSSKANFTASPLREHFNARQDKPQIFYWARWEIFLRRLINHNWWSSGEHLLQPLHHIWSMLLVAEVAKSFLKIYDRSDLQCILVLKRMSLSAHQGGGEIVNVRQAFPDTIWTENIKLNFCKTKSRKEGI